MFHKTFTACFEAISEISASVRRTRVAKRGSNSTLSGATRTNRQRFSALKCDLSITMVLSSFIQDLTIVKLLITNMWGNIREEIGNVRETENSAAVWKRM